jgi:hypothetical protein
MTFLDDVIKFKKISKDDSDKLKELIKNENDETEVLVKLDFYFENKEGTKK